jgi:hypothetical protein
MQTYITYTVVPRVMLLIQLINDEYSIHWLLSARDIIFLSAGAKVSTKQWNLQLRLLLNPVYSR